MSRVLFISDTHFAHKNIHKFRKGFASSKEHDEFLTGKITSFVKKRDVLWIPGDVCFNEEGLWCLREIRKCCNDIRWVLGNHDTESVVNIAIQERLVDHVYGFQKYKKSWVSHSPIHPNELRGRINIHGHVHYATVDDPRYFNVCCENVNFTPIDYQQIIKGRTSND